MIDILLKLYPIITLIITLVIALISYLSSEKSLNLQKELTEKNLHASIISQARIDWIQEVRKIMADYLLKATYFPSHYGEYYEEGHLIDSEEETKSRREIDNKVKEIQALKYLLVLYFSDNHGNREIRNAIEEVSRSINRLIEEEYPKTDNVDLAKEFKYDIHAISELTNIATRYFKQEWDKAKKLE